MCLSLCGWKDIALLRQESSMANKDLSFPVKPFPGHLQIWYEEEDRKDPNWRDFDPDQKDSSAGRQPRPDLRT